MKPADIIIEPTAETPYWAVVRAGGRVIGNAYKDDSDGLWRFHGFDVRGMIDAWVLRAIADRLDAMNADWSTKLDAAYRSGALGTPSTDRIHE